ncbi:MAG: MOSC domain-containing protein [Gammaproteobacteria bacterium]|nr:MOSC domain-containing protein [Gammaproteobacteria bacterium]
MPPLPEHCTVTALYTYPVKSCRGTAVESATISPTGIEGDRQLMVLAQGRFVNQVRLPKLATVATRRIDPTTIAFSTMGGAPFVHSVTADGTGSTVLFYGNAVPVVDQGDAVAAWISEAVGTELRIAALEATFRRSVPLYEFAAVDGIDQSRFVDVAPILMTNEASLADLNARLDTPVPMNRFRPNIVIGGLDAFAEDSVSHMSHGRLRLVRATHCERCAVTCTDQETGQRAAEPLRTLRSYRHRENGYAGGVLFGAYMGVEGTATIRVGDALTVQVPGDP